MLGRSLTAAVCLLAQAAAIEVRSLGGVLGLAAAPAPAAAAPVLPALAEATCTTVAKATRALSCKVIDPHTTGLDSGCSCQLEGRICPSYKAEGFLQVSSSEPVEALGTALVFCTYWYGPSSAAQAEAAALAASKTNILAEELVKQAKDLAQKAVANATQNLQEDPVTTTQPFGYIAPAVLKDLVAKRMKQLELFWKTSTTTTTTRTTTTTTTAATTKTAAPATTAATSAAAKVAAAAPAAAAPVVPAATPAAAKLVAATAQPKAAPAAATAHAAPAAAVPHAAAPAAAHKFLLVQTADQEEMVNIKSPWA